MVIMKKVKKAINSYLETKETDDEFFELMIGELIEDEDNSIFLLAKNTINAFIIN